MMECKPIKPEECSPWLLQKHYARRLCPISYAFGLFVDGVLRGVCTYGVPASSPLRSGVCGPDYAGIVLELNRLCCDEIKNGASFLVGNSLAMLPKPSIVVSFADTAQGHIGYVYQATNWIYTGLSAKRTDWKIKGLEHLHGTTVADMSRGQENRVEYMRVTYGNDFYLDDRPRKHRYVAIVGSKTQKKTITKALRYLPEPYPKGESKRYDAGGTVPTQAAMF
jgi:hypothetical protein